MKLYEVVGELGTIEAEIIDAEGALTPEIEARLDALAAAFEAKAEGIAKLVRELEGQAAVAEGEADRLAVLARTRRNAAAGLAGRPSSEDQMSAPHVWLFLRLHGGGERTRRGFGIARRSRSTWWR